MGYHVGVDVGGTFTDVLLIDTVSGQTWRAKTASTSEDQSIGVLRGIERVCAAAEVSPGEINEVLHGTTVATNAILEGKGATVGLVTTRGFRQILQIARSYVPGGLAGWIIWPKPEPPAALENTVEMIERIDARGSVVTELDEQDARAKLAKLKANGIEALCISLINSFANAKHERRLAELAAEVLPGVSVSVSSTVLPELREYERTITTVVNGYVQPQVARYVRSLSRQLHEHGIDGKLSILRSDGGLATAEVAADNPVGMLLSGPAGGVTGATWAAEQAGFRNFLTFDMGGTSTDVCLVQDLKPRIGRDTTVGDISVRATAVDIRTVGAGGGSIAHVPQLTQALRVGPQSAGAVPGPAAYGAGGTEPTVTDADVVLGYLPSELAGGEITLDMESARTAVQRIADSTDLGDVRAAAAGIIDIVNENMFGALRLVSVQQGFDPRDFALVAFGGAGPLHANALGKLIGSWPVIIPPSPGVLNAYGDAMTSLRDEAARTFIVELADLTDRQMLDVLASLSQQVRKTLSRQGIRHEEQTLTFQVDMRYHGQGFEIPIDLAIDDFENADPEGRTGLDVLAKTFDAEHQRLFSFLLDNDHEIVNVRVTASGPRPAIAAQHLPDGVGDPSTARTAVMTIWVEGGEQEAGVYDREKLRAGDAVQGPAIITDMDATTLVLPRHVATVHPSGSLLIYPVEA